MRILYITDALAVWGGIERVLRDKANYLVEHYGYDVHIVTTDQGPHPIPYPLDERVKVHDLDIRFHHQYRYCGFKRIFTYWKLHRLFKQRLKSCIEQIKPDVLVCIRIESVNSIISVKGDIPLICESHSMCYAYLYENATFLYRLRFWWARKNIRKADCIVALTEGDANDWRRSHPNVKVIPNIVHLNDTGRYSDLQSKKVIFVGRFSAQKDFGSMIEIWRLVHQRHPDWELHAYGEGEQKEGFQKEIAKSNINITLHEPTANIFNKYLESSILCMTSLYEPFGLVLPEAMSCGLPVIAFNCPYGPDDIITDGVNGFLIKNRNQETFAKQICLLMDSTELRQKIGYMAAKSVSRYQTEVIMPKWKSFFETINRNVE